MKLIATLVTAILTVGLAPGVYAGDPAAGKAKSTTCVACHGAQGVSANELWPNLAGQKQGYLIKQMKAFRDGDRKDPMMAPMVAALSDEDIENLAAYYSSLGN